MCQTIKKLGEAELEIMQVIWGRESPVTSNYILKEMKELRKWQLSTLMTSLSRLEDKGFLICDRASGTNLYSPVITENDYKARESRHFLDRLYNNSVQNLVATLYGNKIIKDSDIAELRDFLDQMEEENSHKEGEI